MLHQSGSIQSCRGDGWTSSRQPNYFDEEFCVANTKGSAARWFWCCIFCLACYVPWIFFSKLGGDEIPPRTMQYLFNLGGLPVGLVFLALRRFRMERNLKGITYGLIVGVLSALGQLALFGAYHGSDKYIGGNRHYFALSTGHGHSCSYFFARAADTDTGRRNWFCPNCNCHIFLLTGYFFAHLMALVCARRPRHVGCIGIFQKLSTNHISSESVMILLIVGSFAIQPFVLPQQPLSSTHTALFYSAC